VFETIATRPPAALTMTRIDSHQHFWSPARGDYTWLRTDDPVLAPLQRAFLPADLEPILQASATARTVLVQAADSVAETDFLLCLAKRNDFIGGVVGWVDLSRSDAVATLEAWARYPQFKGVRPMLQDLPEVDWIERAPRADAVMAMIRLGLRLDALVKPQHLPSLLRFLRAWPDLQVVIDHGAKPQLAQGWQSEWAPLWRRGMAELAALPRVHCKFSGVLTELQPHQRASAQACVDEVRPVWDALLEWFGPERLMWGSDWPVVTLASSYDQWLATAEVFISQLPPSEQDAVWRGTAQRFYAIA
jgi:L-fuconolactonase